MKEVITARVTPEIKKVIKENDNINISKIIEEGVKEKLKKKEREKIGINSLYIGFGLIYLLLSPMILLSRNNLYPAMMIGVTGLLFITLGTFNLLDIGGKKWI